MIVTLSHKSGDSFALGATEVTVTARDQSNNINKCSFTVTVIGEFSRFSGVCHVRRGEEWEALCQRP